MYKMWLSELDCFDLLIFYTVESSEQEQALRKENKHENIFTHHPVEQGISQTKGTIKSVE